METARPATDTSGDLRLGFWAPISSEPSFPSTGPCIAGISSPAEHLLLHMVIPRRQTC